MCKACRRERIRARYAANPEAKLALNRVWREAHPDLMAEYSRKRQSSPEGKAYLKRWREDNRDSSRTASRRYYRKNREKELQRQAVWRTANPEKIAALAKLLRASGKPTEYNRRYRARYPDKVRAKLGRRRARIVGVEGVDLVDYGAIILRDGMICHICGGVIESYADLNFDHVAPLARGGPHTAENIKPAHRRCNQLKGAKVA